MNIVKANIKQVRKPRQQVTASKAVKAKVLRQKLASFAVIGVGVVLTGLSLTHLSSGVQAVTSATEGEALSMALGIDLGFIALELANLLTITEATRRRISRFTQPAIVGTLATSAVMNAFAFSSKVPAFDLGSPWFNFAPAVFLGFAIPAMIFALMRVGTVLFLASLPVRGNA